MRISMNLPPLNALRAFEAAARHESFSSAANELHVSPGAVSRHVKLLEEHLGVILFRRRPRGLVLTETGRKLLPEITASFEKIVEATSELVAHHDKLKVMAPTTLGMRWVVPRLQRFRDRHPEIFVNVGTYHEGWEPFYEGNFDAGICCYEFNFNMPADLTSVFVRKEALAPVCAPSLLEGPDPLLLPRDIAKHDLLHVTPDYSDWRKWLDAAGVLDAVDVKSGQTFDSMELAVQAAMAGLGVTTADLHFYKKELAAGQLVIPFDIILTEETGYFLFCQKGRLDEPAIVAFKDWLIHEAAVDEVAWSDKAVGRKVPADIT